MEDKFDKLYREANTPEAKKAVEEYFMANSWKGGGVKYMCKDGFKVCEKEEGKDD